MMMTGRDNLKIKGGSLHSKSLENKLLTSLKTSNVCSTHSQKSFRNTIQKPLLTEKVLLQKLKEKCKTSSNQPTGTLKNNLLIKLEKVQDHKPLDLKKKTPSSNLHLGGRTTKSFANIPSRNLTNKLLSRAVKVKIDLSNRQLETRHNLLSGFSHVQTKNCLLAPTFSKLQGSTNIPASNEELQICEVPLQVKTSPSNSADIDFKVRMQRDLQFPSATEASQTGIQETSVLSASKSSLIDCVCTALINSPVWFSASDKTRTSLYQLCEEVASSDPEFVLKTAFYTRRELNIRVVCNFILAVASLLPACRPYLKKYFTKSIVLPSDWIQVAEFYQSLSDPDDFGGNVKLPSALRKVMVTKFPDFDEYSLGKYNKDKTKKAKKKKKTKGKTSKKEDGKKENFESAMQQKLKDLEESKEQEISKNANINAPSFTLKFLIRKLHIKKPANHVMCILGKKYPDNIDSFYRAGLEGTWDSVLAGKRMKLEVPETWETQVSAKGNIAKTWQDLLDHKKLPFMAMLRNIRNMIKAGVLDKYHTKVLKTLTNERAVMKSKQFPFRFFSAYEVLDELKQDIQNQAKYKQHGFKAFLNKRQKSLLKAVNRSFGDQTPKSKEEKEIDFIKKQLHRKYGNPLPYDEALLARYEKALNEAVKIATVNNVPPIVGHTVVFCDVRFESLQKKCSGSKGLGTVRTLSEVGILLGLMCAYSCEACTFLICAGQKYRMIELETGGILENVKRIMKIATVLGSDPGKKFLPSCFLDNILIDRTRFDNLLVLSNKMEDSDEIKLDSFLERYKENINSHIKCYEVDLSGKRPTLTTETIRNDVIKFAGYSDQILKYISLGSGKEQINSVDNIDQKYDLCNGNEKRETMSGTSLPIVGNIPKPVPWKTVKVFISSTIKDMLSERDTLVSYVFPLLRKIAQEKHLHVYETDLRWGITSDSKHYDRSVAACLQEVRKCDIFIGILGERYGWIPPDYGFSDKGSEWLEEYPKGRSITELEINQAAFVGTGQNKICFFYFRQSSDLKQNLPKKLKDVFFETNSKKQLKLKDLKQRIRDSAYPLCENYPAQWGGAVNGSPVVTGLNEFEKQVSQDLRIAMCSLQSDATYIKSSFKEEDPHIQFASEQNFVARSALFTSLLNKVTAARTDRQGKIVALTGNAGSGKSALLSAVYNHIASSCTLDHQDAFACVHFASPVVPDGQSACNVMLRFCLQIRHNFGITDVNVLDDFERLIDIFPTLLKKVHQISNQKPSLYLFIDDVDSLDGGIDWIQKILYPGITVVVTCSDSGSTKKALKHMSNVTFQNVIDLTNADKREVVRSVLGKHSKKLDESHFNNQMRVLISKTHSINPLYLNTVCEMMRVQETYESLTKTLTALPHNLSGVLGYHLKEVESKFSEYPGLVGIVLGIIYCSMRWNISEEDLYDAVCLGYKGANDEKLEETNDFYQDIERSIPRAVLFRILNSLRSFIVTTSSNDGSVLSLAHNIHINLVREYYFANSDFIRTCHCILVDLYTLRLRQQMSQSEADLYILAKCLSRLPLHLTLSKQNKVLRALLTDFNFIHLKCCLGLGMDLLEDFSYLQNQKEKKLRAVLSTEGKITVPWQEMHKFVLSCIHIISKYPEMVYQFALNEPEGSYPYAKCSEIISGGTGSGKTMFLCLEQKNRADLPDLCSRTYNGHIYSDHRTCIATLSESRLMAWGSKSGRVGTFDLKSGKDCHAWFGHGDNVLALSFIDKSTLLSASADGTVCVWNISEGYRIRSFKAHEGRVSGIIVQPLSQGSSARVFATASHDRTIGFWNVSNQKLVHRLKTDSASANCLDFHPHEQVIVVGLWDCSLRIWNVQTLKRIAVIRGHEQAVSCVQYSKCGNYIASCSAFESVIRLWAAGAGIPLGNFGETFLTSPKFLTFSSDGKYLVGAGEGTNENSSQLVAWKSHLGSKELNYTVLRAEECGDTLCCSFNTFKTFLAVGFHGGDLAIYDPKSPSPVFSQRIHESQVNCVVWTQGNAEEGLLPALFNQGPQEEYVITGSNDGSLKAVSSSSLSMSAILKGHSGPVLSVACTQTWVASGSEDFSILLWHLGEISTPEISVITHSKALHSHESPVSCLAFKPDGTMLVSGGRDGKLVYWDIDETENNFAQGNIVQGVTNYKIKVKSVATIDQAHMDWITCCSWNDSSDHIVTGSNDTNLKIWACPQQPLGSSSEYKVPLYVLKGHKSGITSVIYRFGCISSTGGDDCTIRIWSHKGVEITSLKTESRTNCCDVTLQSEVEVDEEPLNFDEDDVREEFNWAEQVDLEEWNNEHQKRKPGSKKKRKAVAAEMRKFEVACASSQASVSLWKPLIGNKISIMNGRSKCINQVVVSGKKEVASCSSEGTVRLWKLSPTSNVQHHNGEVTDMILMNDCIVTSCDAGFLYIWTETSKNRFHLQYKLQAHTKRITAVCLLESFTFASVSLDGTVSIWQVRECINQIEENQNLNINSIQKTDKGTTKELVKLNARSVGMPLISAALDSQSTDVTAFWISDNKQMCMKYILSANREIISPTTDKKICSLGEQIQICKTDLEKDLLFFTDKGSVFENIALNIELEKGEFLYSSVIAIGMSSQSKKKTFIAGSSLGYLYIPAEEKKLKMHDGRITALLDSENYLITCSFDCTVKVWEKPSLIQIGQFFTTSPITTAIYNINESSMILGDSSGMVNKLKLQTLSL